MIERSCQNKQTHPTKGQVNEAWDALSTEEKGVRKLTVLSHMLIETQEYVKRSKEAKDAKNAAAATNTKPTKKKK